MFDVIADVIEPRLICEVTIKSQSSFLRRSLNGVIEDTQLAALSGDVDHDGRRPFEKDG